MKSIKNYIKISDTISTSGQPTKKQFKKIAKEGFDVVLNIAMHNNGAIKEEDKIVSKNGMSYIHIPITWDMPEIDRFQLALDTLHFLQSQNKKVYVHCIMNWRVSILIYQYKKSILKEKKTKINPPKDFNPNKKWKKFMKMEF